MYQKSKRMTAWLLALALSGVSAFAASGEIIIESSGYYPPENGQVMENPLSAEEFARLQSQSTFAFTRASHTFGIVGWAANSAHVLESNIELESRESVEVSGEWDNPNVRMTVTLYERRNDSWFASAGSTFSSNSSTTVSPVSAGLYRIEVTPQAYMGGGHVRVTYG